MRLAIIDLDEIERKIDLYKKIKAKELNQEEKPIWGAIIDGIRETAGIAKPLDKLDRLTEQQKEVLNDLF